MDANTDALAALIGYLKAHIPVTVASETPSSGSPPFLTVMVSLNRSEDLIAYEDVTATIWTWDTSEAKAAELMAQVRQAMQAAERLANISDMSTQLIRVSNPEQTNLRRYEGVFRYLYRPVTI